MNEKSKTEWWAWLAILGFLLVGIYFLKLWRKSINPKATFGERCLDEGINLITGVAFIMAGIMFLAISIYQACTGWIAK